MLLLRDLEVHLGRLENGSLEFREPAQAGHGVYDEGQFQAFGGRQNQHFTSGRGDQPVE